VQALPEASAMTRINKLTHIARREYIKLMMACGVQVLEIWEMP
jgi:hypothetical protein